MDTSFTAPISTEMGKRSKAAALGFVLSVTPLIGFACVQILLAPSIVANAGFNPETEVWAVAAYRKQLFLGYAWVVTAVFSYWMAVWAWGRGYILKSRWANLTLSAAVFAFGLAMVTGIVVPVPATLFEWACPSLGLSEAHPKFGFDVSTPCEAFASKAAPTALLGLPLLLLTVSALTRVMGSRRSWRRSVC